MPKQTPPHTEKEGDPGQQAHYLLFYDELTGLYNRRFYNRTYEEQTRKAREEHGNLGLILIDVDFFKSINDRYGHQQGDAILSGVGNLINEVVGIQGYPIRYAGDEFVVLLPGLSRAEATTVAENLGTKVREVPFKLLNTDRTVKITFSIGVSHHPEDVDDPGQLFEAADHAAYIAKKQGRDRVINYQAGAAHVLDPTTLYHYFPCPRLIGRDKLLADLLECLSGPADSVHPWAILAGTSGSGKTRLLQELRSRVDRQRRVLLETVGLPHRPSQPFGFLVDAIGAFLRENPQAGQQVASALNTVEIAAVSQLLPDLSRHALLAAPSAGDPENRNDDARTTRDPLLEPLCKVLLTLAHGKSMSLMFDDFHRADQGTLQVLKMLREREPKVFVCFSVRDDEETLEKNPSLTAFMNHMVELEAARRIPVEPFHFLQVQELIETVLPGGSKFTDLVDLVHEKSHGLPLLIEEVLKFLIVQRSIYYQGPTLVVENLSRELIPTDAEQLLEVRAGQVDEEVSALMARAAVIGEEFDFATLMSLEGRDEGYLRGILERARRAHIIAESWSEDSNRINFVSAHTHSAYYRLNAEEERRKLHLRLGRLREWQYAGQLDAALSELSFHFARAGETQRANQYKKIVSELYSQFARPSDEGASGGVKDLVTEVELSNQVLELAVDTMGEFKSCLLKLRMYGSEHLHRKGAYDQLMVCFGKLFEVLPEVTYAEADKSLIINGTVLPPQQRYSSIVEVFAFHSIKGITFKDGMTSQELRACLEFLGLPKDELRARGGLGKLLNEVSVTHIVPNEKLYVAVGERDILLKRTSMRDEMLIKEVDAPAPPPASSSPAPPATPGSAAASAAESTEGPPSARETDSLTSIEIDPSTATVLAGASFDSLDVDMRKLANISAEMAQYQREIGRYNDLKLLGALGKDWGVLARDLESGNRIKIAAASKAYMDLDKQSIEPLTQLVGSTQDTRARHLAVSLLRRLMPDAMEHLLRQCYQAQMSTEKCNYIEALENFNDASLVSELSPFVRHADREVRQAAIRFLARKTPQEVGSLLLDALSDERDEVRFDAVAAIGREKIASAAPALLKLIDRTSIFFFEAGWKLQAQACISLGQLGEQAAIAPLKECVARQSGMYRTKPTQVREAALTALVLLGTPENQRQLLAEVQKYQSDADTVVRAAAQKAGVALQKDLTRVPPPPPDKDKDKGGGAYETNEIKWRSIRRTG